MIVKTFLPTLTIVSLLIAAVPALSQEDAMSAVDRWREDPLTIFDATEIDVADFQWIARPVVVFADSEAVPIYQEQMELLLSAPNDLVRRDVVVVTDTDPAAASDLRRQYRPRGFQLTLIGKDGGVKLRKPMPWSVREISRTIDKMPMRQRELREGGS